MNFVSYRDPNVESTLDIYANAGRFLLDEPVSAGELERGIIGMMGDLDPCQLPDAKGYGSMLRHLNGLSDERRQRVRDEVMSTTVDDFKAFGELLNLARKPEHVVILGPESGLARASAHIGEDLDTIKLT